MGLAEKEKDCKMKNRSRKRPQTSAVYGERFKKILYKKLKLQNIVIFSFISENELKIYLQTPHKKNKFEFSFCGYKRNLKRHMLNHQNVNLFKCSEFTKDSY